jgi:hypothetical protein
MSVLWDIPDTSLLLDLRRAMEAQGPLAGMTGQLARCPLNSWVAD